MGAEIGLAGRFLTANARFCGIAGHPWEELRELHFQDITGPENRRARGARRRGLASEHEPYWYEIYGPEKVFGMCYQVDQMREGRDIGLAVVRKAAGRRRWHEFRAGRGQQVLGGIAVGDRTLSHG